MGLKRVDRLYAAIFFGIFYAFFEMQIFFLTVVLLRNNLKSLKMCSFFSLFSWFSSLNANAQTQNIAERQNTTTQHNPKTLEKQGQCYGVLSSHRLTPTKNAQKKTLNINSRVCGLLFYFFLSLNADNKKTSKQALRG